MCYLITAYAAIYAYLILSLAVAIYFDLPIRVE